jgi:hypothetical protein
MHSRAGRAPGRRRPPQGRTRLALAAAPPCGCMPSSSPTSASSARWPAACPPLTWYAAVVVVLAVRHTSSCGTSHATMAVAGTLLIASSRDRAARRRRSASALGVQAHRRCRYISRTAPRTAASTLPRCRPFLSDGSPESGVVDRPVDIARFAEPAFALLTGLSSPWQEPCTRIPAGTGRQDSSSPRHWVTDYFAPQALGFTLYLTTCCWP